MEEMRPLVAQLSFEMRQDLLRKLAVQVNTQHLRIESARDLPL
jgi:hypothetical protein